MAKATEENLSVTLPYIVRPQYLTDAKNGAIFSAVFTLQSKKVTTFWNLQQLAVYSQHRIGMLHNLVHICRAKSYSKS